MEQAAYYAIITKKARLRCVHPDWLVENQRLYNDILFFYYRLFVEQNMDSGCKRQIDLRDLEKLTIVGRDQEPVPYPLPWRKVPLYFRRAAINAAIAAGKSYLSGSSQTKMAEKFAKSVTFYKGMYREFNKNSIQLKVWNGFDWKWITCHIYGAALPDDVQYLSPSVVLHGQFTQLHIPVRYSVKDGRRIQDRIKQGANLCSIQFTNGDVFAACVVLDKEGNQKNTFFLKGGSEYVHRCNIQLKKMEESRNAQAGKKDKTQENNKNSNNKYWLKLKNISQFFSNNISRQVINKSSDNQVDIIVLPKYEDGYTKNVMNQSGKWSPLYLSYKIREQLKYKAWKEGILVLEVNPRRTGLICSVCGASISKKGQQFICGNGHQGNRHLNAARNLGKRFYEEFGCYK